MKKNSKIRLEVSCYSCTHQVFKLFCLVLKTTKIHIKLTKIKIYFSASFNDEQFIKSTELSKYIWPLKVAGTPCTINWSIVAKIKGSTKVNYCPLCLTETYHLIEYFNDTRFLNKKSEFINACRHQSILLLKNLKRNERVDRKNIKGTCREVFLYFC